MVYDNGKPLAPDGFRGLGYLALAGLDAGAGVHRPGVRTLVPPAAAAVLVRRRSRRESRRSCSSSAAGGTACASRQTRIPSQYGVRSRHLWGARSWLLPEDPGVPAWREFGGDEELDGRQRIGVRNQQHRIHPIFPARQPFAGPLVLRRIMRPDKRISLKRVSTGVFKIRVCCLQVPVALLDTPHAESRFVNLYKRATEFG